MANEMVDYSKLKIEGAKKPFLDWRESDGAYQGYQEKPQEITQLPNYDKLTRTERWIMDRLPGIADSGFGKLLQAVNNSPIGKALQVLDVGAEAVERTIGLGAQYLDAIGDEQKMSELNDNLKAAWQAGSLTSDVARIPQIRNVNGESRFIVTDDLPGMQGLVDARRRIIAGESLEDVRASMLDDMGALAIRAQLQDVAQHIFLDPMMLVGKYIKPVEMINKWAIKAKVLKALPSQLDDVSRGIDDLTNLVNRIDKLSDLKTLEKAAQKADDLAELENIAKLNNILSDLGKGAKKEDVLAFLVERADALKAFEKMSPAEQKLLQYSGNFLGLEKPWDELSGFQKMLRRFNPLALSPQARAHELMTDVINHFSSYVIAKTDDPLEMVRVLRRTVDGTAGADLGHMIVTPTGRIFQGVMKKNIVNAETMLKLWNDLADERRILNDIAAALGDSPSHVYRQLLNGESAQIYSRFMEIAQPEQLARIEEFLQLRGLTKFEPGILESIPEMFKGIELFTPDHFKAQLLNSMMDELKKFSVLQFGIKQEGMIQRVADTIKAAESLAYLRMNPAYPIKNFINNTVTTMARGNFGIVSLDTVEKFWDEVLGFIPARATEAYTPAELLQKGAEASKASTVAIDALRKGSEAVSDVVRGERGWLGKVADKIRNFSVSDLVGAEKKWDFGTWAQDIERASSQRAYYLGYVRNHKEMWSAGKGFDRVVDFDAKLASGIGDEIANIIETGIANSWNEQQIAEAIYKGDNIAMNMPNIMKRAEQKLSGTNIEGVLGHEFIASIQDEIITAAKKGESALNETMTNVTRKIEKSIDDWLDETIEYMVDEAAARVETEGSSGLAAILTDASDDVFATSARHAIDTQAIASDIRKGTDPVIASARWKKLFDDSGRYYDRFWKRQEKIIDTVTKKAKKIGLDDFGAEIKSSFKDIKSTWNNFYKKRTRLWTEFGDARAAGKNYKMTAAEIRAELNLDYQKAFELEDFTNRRMDEILSMMLPEEQRQMFLAARDGINKLRKSDREFVLDFRNRLPDMLDDEIETAYQAFWQQRMRNYADLWQEEQKAYAAMGGNQQAQGGIKLELNLQPNIEEKRGLIREAIDRLPENLKEKALKNFEKFEQQSARIGEEFGEEAEQAATRMWLDDFHSIVKRELPAAVVMEELYYNRAIPALDAIKDSALEIGKEKPLKFANLAPEAQNGIRKYVSHVQGQMSDVRLASMKFGEYTRDAALLNYSRRTNLDNWLQAVVPYEFWTMHTAWKWALHTVDRPHVTANILRLKKFIDTGFRPESGFPSRLKGHIRIKMPFLSKIFGDWFGDEIFVNPMSVAVPIENFTRPYEEYASQERRDIGSAERVLEELLGDGKITQEEYINAMQSHAGPVWERAVGLVRQDDTEGRLNAFDLGSMLLSPHAPLMWAYNASRGEEWQQGPFTPIGRSMQAIAGLFGVDTNDIPVLGIGGKIRQAMGLHPFDAWGDYRINRMMVNMLSLGEKINDIPITLEDVNRAMIEKTGPLYEEAKRRANIEYGVNAMGSITGIPTKAYPPGEENVRAKAEGYQEAWKEYEAGDHDAVNRFLEANPDYEARIALFKEPEAQLRSFVVDQIWDTYNNLTSLDKREVREQLGDNFVNAVLNKETRSTDSLPVEMLATWLKMMGGDPPGTLGQEAVPINMAPPEIKQAAQYFYDYRTQNYPNYFEQQEEYYKLEEGSARRYYRNVLHPELGEYFSWKWDYLYRNPSVAPYLSENPPTYASYEELQKAQMAEPNITPQELIATMGQATYNQVLDLLYDEDPLDSYAEDKLEEIADRAGLDIDDIIAQVAQSIGLQ